MQSFLSKVCTEVLTKYNDTSNLIFVLPSKRARLFLKTEIKKQLNKASILPSIISIEDFIQNLSGLNQIDPIHLTFEFYSVYKEITPESELDSFEVFSKWSSQLLQDFNEIDSNLFDAKNLLKYINESRQLENWNLEENQTELTNRYLKFFSHIEKYYSSLKSHLTHKNLGYQGMLYRTAFENTDHYLESLQKDQFIFSGFNALNIAEEKIINEFLLKNKAEIYWDNDTFYSENNIIAGKYFKKYKNTWSYYKAHKFKWTESLINTKKNIEIEAVPKNVSQIKKVSTILQKLAKENKIQDTAVILGNEKLLPVLLNSLPKNIDHVNITMGYELQNIPLSDLFDHIFRLHIHSSKFKKKEVFYYKDFTKIIQHPTIQSFWNNNDSFKTNLNTLLYKNKTVFISQNDIKQIIPADSNLTKIFHLLFLPWKNDINTIIKRFIAIIEALKNNEALTIIDKEYLFRFYKVFQQLINLNNDYGYISNLNTLYQFYKQLLKTESLSFQGEPLKGLQVMGLLESRVLDFENVIITSANEGFIPSGNMGNSFIPFDIKIEKELPTSKEKDAIFSYHFFRLFHRAKNIYLLYNSETDDFGSGEQSRFITQLEIAKTTGNLDHINIKKNIIIPKFNSDIIDLDVIEKSDKVLNRLQELASKGFSPSSLSLYIRNPLDFYKRKILNLKEYNEVEETVAANTFGTIIHDTLENLYKPFIGKYISIDDVKKLKGDIDTEVSLQFDQHYSLKAISSGKNYLSFEIAKQFVLNFLNFEISELKNNKKIKIIALEEELELSVPIKRLSFPVKIKGKVDRIDETNGVLRIIDYKTGNVSSSQLKIKDWELLTTDEKYSKSFQVLTYAYLYTQINNRNFNFETAKMESGIISFKNLRSGFMKVDNALITQSTMDLYLQKLNDLILEIFNLDIPFNEKEVIPFKK
jgi:hypothetical protein